MLLNRTVPVPGVNVPPLLVQSPLGLIVAAVPAANVPALSVAVLTLRVVVLPPTVSVPPPLLTVKLLKVCVAAVPFKFWPAPPLKVTVPVPGVNVPPLLVQLTATLIFAAVPAANVPEVSNIVPLSGREVVLPPTVNIWAVFATVILLKV